MRERTQNRKLNDLSILKKMFHNSVNESRTLYYIADTYLSLHEWKKSKKWFKRRASIREGNISEIRDSLYYIAALSDEKLESSWKSCYSKYLKCYMFDTKQTDVLFVIGKKYLDMGNTNLAYMFMRHAFIQKRNYISQMSCRMYIYNTLLPYNLLTLCYMFNDYALGLDVANSVLDHSYDSNHSDLIMIASRFKIIYESLVKCGELFKSMKINEPSKPVLCFVSPDGWDNWTGRTYYEKGLGGSETFIVKYAEKIAEMNKYDVYVFCKCLQQETYNNVIYMPICEYSHFAYITKIVHCFINRQPSYLPLTYKSAVENVYLVLHDTTRTDIIIDDKKLVKIFCISKWHQKNFDECYPSVSYKSDIISYGIDTNKYNFSNSL
jgi:hypothetical protein